MALDMGKPKPLGDAVKPELSRLADIGDRLVVGVTTRVTSRKCGNLGTVCAALVLVYDRLNAHKSISLGEFPDVFRTDVYLVWPNERAVADKHLAEEVLVVQSLPVGLVQIARTIENAAFAGVKHDIDLVAVKRLRRDNIVYRFHRAFRVLNAVDRS